MGGSVAARVGQKVIVEVTIHDGMLDRHLRHDLWERSGKICRQGSINEPDFGGAIEFKFKRHYKLQRATQQTTLGHLRIELLSRALIVVSWALIEPLSSRVLDFWTDTMATIEEVMEIT